MKYLYYNLDIIALKICDKKNQQKQLIKMPTLPVAQLR